MIVPSRGLILAPAPSQPLILYHNTCCTALVLYFQVF
jgi:hypothetical protein